MKIIEMYYNDCEVSQIALSIKRKYTTVHSFLYRQINGQTTRLFTDGEIHRKLFTIEQLNIIEHYIDKKFGPGDDPDCLVY